jgi:hypothetical protein
VRYLTLAEALTIAEAVSTMVAIAAGELDEVAVAAWLTDQLDADTT